MRRKESVTRSPPRPQDSVADSLAAAALRPFERGRRPTRREEGGSASERSDSPVVWRPTISHPTLQQDSLGIGATSDIVVEPFKQRLVPFLPSKNGRSITRGQGLVENPPRPRTRAGGAGSATATTTKTTALSLFPNPDLDDKVASEAFNKMFETEKKAQAYQVQAQAKAMAQAQAQTDRAMGFTQAINGDSSVAPTPASFYNNKKVGGGNETDKEDDYGVKPPPPSSKTAAVARKVDKMLPNVPFPTALRRIKTGQVKTVTVAASSGPRRPLKRSNTADVLTAATSSSSSSSSNNIYTQGSANGASPPQISAPTNFVKVRTGGPVFSFAGVADGIGFGSSSGKHAQEFEIVTGPDGSMLAEPVLGSAF